VARGSMQTERAIGVASATSAEVAADAATLPADDHLQAVLDVLPVGVLIFQSGPGGTPVCLSSNATFETWARYPENQLIGLTLPRIRLLSENPRIAVAVETLLGEPSGAEREIDWSVAESPRQRHLSAHIARLPHGKGLQPRVLVAVRDRTPEIQAERNLRQTMLNDALTGLPNRVLFAEQVEEALEADEDSNLAVAIVNVDRFKRVNDSLGHVVGDELLISVARRLLPCVRANDCVGRLSGDEFAILMKDIEAAEDTGRVVERVQNAMKAPFTISGGEYFVSASIGVATTFSSRRYAEDLIRDADFALNTAKARGRGGFAIHQSSAHGAARDLFRLETDLRKALERGELELHYQPFVSLTDYRLAGFEALARWHHPERGQVSPGDFIPVAEDTGLIVPLGRWAIETACRQLADWRAAFAGAGELSIGVNVSGIQLARDDIVAVVEQALAASGLPGGALKVELTESAIVENPELAKEIFGRLKALDCSIAMDDFGTGYSSLSYLQSLPIDILKIDRSFVMAMLESEDSYKIITAVMSLSNSLGMKTIAEGVERIEQAERLHALGCDLAQGYYFARPMSADDAARLLAAGGSGTHITAA
jgi:diguanylate cyclase (GGDEF)-like protein